jgi:hypothetical protein
LGTVQYILALSRSAVTIRHWFEIDLDDSSAEHGARIEIRELAEHPRRGSESASQLITADRPLWRADLFDRLADPPGSFSAAHYHPRFEGNEPCERHWDPDLTADPWAWLRDQIASLGTAAGGAAWPLDPGDAAELPGLAEVVVATAQRFAPARCGSAAECFQLTRDVEDAVQLMIATLRAPERLDRDRAAPWLGRLPVTPSATLGYAPRGNGLCSIWSRPVCTAGPMKYEHSVVSCSGNVGWS